MNTRYRITVCLPFTVSAKFYGRTLASAAKKAAAYVWRDLTDPITGSLSATLVVSKATGPASRFKRPTWHFVETVEVVR